METASRAIQYGRITAIEIILIVNSLLLDSLIDFFGLGAWRQWIYLLYFVFEFFYLWVLYHLISRLHFGNKKMINVSLFVMAIIIVSTFIPLNPFIQLTQNKPAWLIAAHIPFCVLQMYVISLLIIEMFKEKQTTTDIFWSSLATYFMIPIAWTSLFEIINLSHPGSAGIVAEPGFQSYSEMLYYSINVFCAAGTFPDNISRLIRNIQVIYHVWGALYLVFLIGRAVGLVTNRK